jgi:hypothetical protein
MRSTAAVKFTDHVAIILIICDGDHLWPGDDWLTFRSATEKPPHQESDDGYSSHAADYASCNGSRVRLGGCFGGLSGRLCW